jgi:hypothetical protein
MPDLQPIVQRISSKYDNTGIVGFLKDLGKIPPSAALAVAGLGMAASFMLDCAKAADESQQINRQLNLTLETTGRIADISAPQLNRFADALAGVSTFDDEQINQAYMAIAQFERVPTDKIDDLAIAAADMSAAMGGDIVNNARTLAGILDTGVIPRGLKFTDVLKAQIQELIKAGDTGAALNLILGEMGTKYGGQAALGLESVSGMTKKLTNDWGEFMEAFGTQETGPLHDAVMGVDAFVVKYTQMANNIGGASNIKGAAWWERIFPPVGVIHDLVATGQRWYYMLTNTSDAEEDLADASSNLTDKQLGLNGALDEAPSKTRTWADEVNALATEMNIGYLEAENLARGINSIPKSTALSVTTYYSSVGSPGTSGTLDVSGSSDYPVKKPGESDADYAARVKAWRAKHPAGHASGGKLGSGWSLVGEEGFELISPSGMVIPHRESERMMKNGMNATGFAEGSFAPRPPTPQRPNWMRIVGTAAGYARRTANAASGMVGSVSSAASGIGGGGGEEVAQAAVSSASEAVSAAKESSSAARSVAKSVGQTNQSQAQTQVTQSSMLAELRKLNANMERLQMLTVAEFKKAMA